MAEIIELLLFLSLLFIMNQSGLPAPIDKRSDNGTDEGSFSEENRAKLYSLEEEVANLTYIIDSKFRDIDDRINKQIENVTAPLKIQIKYLMDKVNQSTSSKDLPTNVSKTTSSNKVNQSTSSTDLPTNVSNTMSSNITDPSTKLNNDSTPSSISSAVPTSSSISSAVPTSSPISNNIPIASPPSNGVNVPSSQSSNTLLGIVITIFAVLVIGLLLYIAYQYRYQIRSWILSKEEQVQCISSAENDETILPQHIRSKGNKKYQRLSNDHND